MFNLRGSDVSYNPVFVSFALIGQEQATLFVGLDKVDDHLRHVLAVDGISVRDYAEIGRALAAIPQMPACWWIRPVSPVACWIT